MGALLGYRCGFYAVAVVSSAECGAQGDLAVAIAAGAVIVWRCVVWQVTVRRILLTTSFLLRVFFEKRYVREREFLLQGWINCNFNVPRIVSCIRCNQRCCFILLTFVDEHIGLSWCVIRNYFFVMICIVHTFRRSTVMFDIMLTEGDIKVSI